MNCPRRAYDRDNLFRSARQPRLFREATQLKTVAAVIRVAGSEVLRTEIQVHATRAARRRRPVEPEAADEYRIARERVAVARGGTFPFLPRGNATENRGRGRPRCSAQYLSYRNAYAYLRSLGRQKTNYNRYCRHPSERPYPDGGSPGRGLSGRSLRGPKTSFASCGPPRGEASGPRGSANRKNSVKLSVVFGLRAPGVGRRPSAQARRFCESRYLLSAQSLDKSFSPSTAPCPPHCGSAVAPPRFARLTRFLLF